MKTPKELVAQFFIDERTRINRLQDATTQVYKVWLECYGDIKHEVAIYVNQDDTKRITLELRIPYIIWVDMNREAEENLATLFVFGCRVIRGVVSCGGTDNVSWIEFS